MDDEKAILVTGCAGFIGFSLAKSLLGKKMRVVGLDNLNQYYDVSLKKCRLQLLIQNNNFIFYNADLENKDALNSIFARHSFSQVLHMAAQAGVRYSLENPHVYVDANVAGFMNILEACRSHKVEHLLYASSSSVYGANRQKPFSVHHNVDHPVSLYAATKKANELMAHTYSYLYDLPTTGVRLFTVYGPWGRPDMALFIFTRAILDDKPIKVYNYGKMKRDFTYIDDAVDGILLLMNKIPGPDPYWNGEKPDPGSSCAPYKIYNVGNNKPVDLLNFISLLEETLGKKAKKEFLPMQPGDVEETCADISDMERDVGYRPAATLKAGLEKYVAWYREYYGG